MRNETIAVHGGYGVDPTTRAVAVPIYQTAYAFDSAEHGAALFNQEVEGYRYSRISNPTNAVLERRIAALEGGSKRFAFAHVLPKLGIKFRFAGSDNPAAIEQFIDEDTRAIFCESVRNPAANTCDVEELAGVAHKIGSPLIVDGLHTHSAARDRLRGGISSCTP
jgi:O-acetylhomoserine (thiol)-lyase